LFRVLFKLYRVDYGDRPFRRFGGGR